MLVGKMGQGLAVAWEPIAFFFFSNEKGPRPPHWLSFFRHDGVRREGGKRHPAETG